MVKASASRAMTTRRRIGLAFLQAKHGRAVDTGTPGQHRCGQLAPAPMLPELKRNQLPDVHAATSKQSGVFRVEEEHAGPACSHSVANCSPIRGLASRPAHGFGPNVFRAAIVPGQVSALHDVMRVVSAGSGSVRCSR